MVITSELYLNTETACAHIDTHLIHNDINIKKNIVVQAQQTEKIDVFLVSFLWFFSGGWIEVQ